MQVNLFRLFPSRNGEEGPVSVHLPHSWVELTLSWGWHRGSEGMQLGWWPG